MKRWLTSGCLLFLTVSLLGGGGCAGRQIPPKEPPVFAVADGKASADVGSDPGNRPIEAPIVKVIAGEPVSADKAAELTGQGENPVTPSADGLHTPIRRMILRNLPIRVVAEVLTDLCDYNVLATPEVAARTVDIYLRNTTLRAGLDALCRLNDIWYREGEGTLTLMTRAEYTDDIVVRQAEQTRAFYVRYTNASDMAKLIKAAMGNDVRLAVIEDEKVYGHLDPDEDASVDDDDVLELKSGNAAMPAHAGGAAPAAASAEDDPVMAVLTVFKRNNCILARSLDGNLLAEMGRIIETLDTPTNQVLLAIRILQVTLDDSFESFFEFDHAGSGSNGELGDFTYTLTGLSGGAASGSTSLSAILSGEDLEARIAFYETEGRVNTVATPFLMAANNSQVEFFVGEDTPLRDDVTTETVSLGDSGETITTYSVEITREELGTDVDISTFINEDGTVTLDIETEISTALLNYSEVTLVNEKSGETVEFPIDGVSKSEVKSILAVRSGQSVAIGGIIREVSEQTETRVPILGDIPVLGYLFRKTADVKEKTETVIVLTPYVIMHPEMAGAVSDGFLRSMSSNSVYTAPSGDAVREENAHVAGNNPGMPADIR